MSYDTEYKKTRRDDTEALAVRLIFLFQVIKGSTNLRSIQASIECH